MNSHDYDTSSFQDSRRDSLACPIDSGVASTVLRMQMRGDFEDFLWAAPRAVTDTTLLITPKAQMIRLLHADHALSDCFIAHLLARNTRMADDLVDHLLNSSEKRLARALLRLAHYGKPGKARRLRPTISQATLAKMVGTTRARINFFMNRFKALGFIEDDAGLRINNSLLTRFAAYRHPMMRILAEAADSRRPTVSPRS